ncbi:MAG: polysaccharide deacetylase family protein [Candidatus Binatia bacterium]
MSRLHGLDFVRAFLTYVTRNTVGAITRVQTKEPVAALTFDDGPDPEFTPQLLDILESNGARGTFFMLGTAAQRYPVVVRRAAEGGHIIGNHSWDHPSFPYISRRERLVQIRACEKTLAPYGQRLFRPPYGHQSFASGLDTLQLGYQVVCWNVIGKDWLDHDAHWIANRVLSQLTPGCIVNFHDALYTTIEERYADRGPMLEAVRIILEQTRERFRFVSIPELLRYGRPHKTHWYRRADVDFLNGLRTQQGDARQYGQDKGGK